mgnify:CR=1 FL=1
MDREKILLQLTKAVRLLEEENYNDKTLNPMRRCLKELRIEMDVSRVSNEQIYYNIKEEK